MKFSDEENTSRLQGRILWVTAVIILFFAIVILRMAYLQILNGEKYRKLAAETFVREEEIIARRGDILDRNNVKLAETRPYFEIAVVPQYVRNQKTMIDTLATLFPIDRDDVVRRLDAAKGEPGFFPVAVAVDVPYDWAVKLREVAVGGGDAPDGLEGVTLRVTPMRRYRYRELFSHVLGYLREIDKPLLDRLAVEAPGVYSRGDLLGAAGVERFYDAELRGQDGVDGRAVDARGRAALQTADVRVLEAGASEMPRAGFHLRTALDIDAQKAASESFVNEDGELVKKGAVVALDPETGAVIALYSAPGYDANRILKGADPAYWKKINLDEDKYLYNRAIQAMYPPASTYKPLSLMSGIASGAIDPGKTTFGCRGGLSFGNRFFKCWNAGGHGTVDPVKALAQSCDVFFYNLGIKTGVDALAKYAGVVGYGSRTGIDLPFESAGLVPSKEWKKKRYDQDWIDSETLSVVIGQSYNLATPLQMAVLAAFVANGGYRIVPHVGESILNPDGSVLRAISFPKQATELTNSPAVDWARRGMIAVVQGAGTAGRLKASPYKIAGKTGTAQVIGHDSKARRGKNTINHGLFIAFAPFDAPKIAVAVIVEHGNSGSGAAAPVAQKVIDAYLGKIMPITAPQAPVKPVVRHRRGRIRR